MLGCHSSILDGSAGARPNPEAADFFWVPNTLYVHKGSDEYVHNALLPFLDHSQGVPWRGGGRGTATISAVKGETGTGAWGPPLPKHWQLTTDGVQEQSAGWVMGVHMQARPLLQFSGPPGRVVSSPPWAYQNPVVCCTKKWDKWMSNVGYGC